MKNSRVVTLWIAFFFLGNASPLEILFNTTQSLGASNQSSYYEFKMREEFNHRNFWCLVMSYDHNFLSLLTIQKLNWRVM